MWTALTHLWEARKPNKYEETTQWYHFVGKGGHLAMIKSHHNHAPWQREELIGLEGFEDKVCAILVKKESWKKG